MRSPTKGLNLHKRPFAGIITGANRDNTGSDNMLDMARVWPIICQFGVGAILGGIGMWAGYSSGYVDLKIPADRRLMAYMVGGYVALLILSCMFTFWLPFIAPEVTP
jgi:hypothetical protein